MATDAGEVKVVEQGSKRGDGPKDSMDDESDSSASISSEGGVKAAVLDIGRKLIEFVGDVRDQIRKNDEEDAAESEETTSSGDSESDTDSWSGSDSGSDDDEDDEKKPAKAKANPKKNVKKGQNDEESSSKSESDSDDDDSESSSSSDGESQSGGEEEKNATDAHKEAKAIKAAKKEVKVTGGTAVWNIPMESPESHPNSQQTNIIAATGDVTGDGQSSKAFLIDEPIDWHDLTPTGIVIPGSRIVCFKTPFNFTRTKIFKHDDAFTTANLLDDLAGKNITLGMVVDLGHNETYYKAKDLEAVWLYRIVYHDTATIPDHLQTLLTFRDSVRNFRKPLRIEVNVKSAMGEHDVRQTAGIT
ncbi:hypothetical protein BV898_01686 [Hypsibius exemplaris]|uniref:Uncharacterized protein n=1 Tax=Hypsibius exemplaris TaxID=2072580 RepID=A0A1W0XAT4_HYPEX|nr:hypothetical protein BV898_01686 [Hypsibius exemplaris]